jgi:hypothetical protein
MRPDVVFSLSSSLTLSHQSASSFFESGLARDSTWFNPRSRLPHCPTTSSSALVTLIKRCVKCSTKFDTCIPTQITPQSKSSSVSLETPRNVLRSPGFAETSALRGNSDDGQRTRTAVFNHVRRHFKQSAPKRGPGPRTRSATGTATNRTQFTTRSHDALPLACQPLRWDPTTHGRSCLCY